MRSDSVEVRLESVETKPVEVYTVSLKIRAYLSALGGRDSKTFEFDCDPIGTNYNRTYLRVRLADWSQVSRIKDFLSHHFNDLPNKTRTLSVPVEKGYYTLDPAGTSDFREAEGIEQISIVADGPRLDFGPGTMSPNIRTYEMGVEGEPQDDNNASKILDFFSEIEESVESDTEWQQISDFEELDPELVASGVVEQLEAGHPQSAIRDSFKVLEERVRHKGDYNTEDYGTQIMLDAFSTDGGPLSFGETDSEKLGALRLYAGAMQMFRNPTAHRSVPIEQQEAAEIIFFVNLLLRLLERHHE
jgi:uncharacterized protein (TIGR02391 family)